MGLAVKEWEQLNIFLNFLITPLIFLGGVFYSTNQVPNAIAVITKFNPMYYMINGARYGLIGYSEAPLWLGITILTLLSLTLFIICFKLFKKGWRLRT